MTAPEDPDAELGGDARRIERLLEDVQALAPAPVWQRVEELVQRLVRLYGAGLERLLGMLPLDESERDRLAGDELVASLLLLHGLHPWPAERRVREALERARPQLREHLGQFTVVAVEAEVVRVRLDGPPSGALSASGLFQRVLADAAPEILRVDVEGLPRPEPREALVQIDLRREASR